MDRGAWWATVHEVAKNQKRLSTHSCLLSCARFWLAALNERVVEGFPGGSDGKESAYNAGDSVSIPGSGRSPGEAKGYPLQHSFLENPMDRGAWRAAVYGVAKNRTQLSN